MKTAFSLTTAGLWAMHAAALSNTIGNNMGVPKDAMISYQSIYFGYAPGYQTASDSKNGGSGITIDQLNTATGQKAATFHLYAQINDDDIGSGKWADPRGQYPADSINNADGAVFIASLMPIMSSWSDITADYAATIADYFTNTFTNQGTTVWLRFAHEVNYYTDPSSGPTYPAGRDTDAYKKAWANMYNAVKGNDKIYLWWCPNADTPNDRVSDWWPGADQVDMVGIDIYPGDANTDPGTFADVYGDFYGTYASANNIPFAIGETGVGGGAGQPSEDQMQKWLKQILNPDDNSLSNYPLYFSATWYETGTPIVGIDWYVVYNQPQNYVLETISNTEIGS